jgi:hypothetical protein
MKKKLDDFEYTDKFLEEAIAEFNELEILEDLEDGWTEEIEALYWAAQGSNSDKTPEELEELKKKDGES